MRAAARLHESAWLAMLLVLGAIQTAALVLQVAHGELPCPLCLLQRVAMFGIAFGLIDQLRRGPCVRATGLSLLWTLVLLIVSARQVLMNITPRPGHSYPGSAVFGLHMPVWSVVIALILLLAFAAELALVGTRRENRPSPFLAGLGGWASAATVALCVFNLGAALLQCGFDACHTSGYRWPH